MLEARRRHGDLDEGGTPTRRSQQPRARLRAAAQRGKLHARRLLKAGRYTFVVADRSSIHNFTLNGPGAANRTITATSFVGTKTVTLTLRRGRYRFYCTVHPTITGTFRVT
jgi:hypothetical protein